MTWAIAGYAVVAYLVVVGVAAYEYGRNGGRWPVDESEIVFVAVMGVVWPIALFIFATHKLITLLGDRLEKKS